MAIRAVSHLNSRCYTKGVPTIKPRYTFTDTGELEALLDAAERQWPEVADRKTLLLRLAEQGASALGLKSEQLEAAERRQRTEAALRRVRKLVDIDVLLSDEAWR